MEPSSANRLIVIAAPSGRVREKRVADARDATSPLPGTPTFVSNWFRPAGA